MIDLRPAADALANVVKGVDPQRLDAATPCTDYRLGDLLDHVAGLTTAFTMAAGHDPGRTGRDTR